MISTTDRALSVALALAAFEKRPTRAEPLYDLARYYREQGMNELALIFADRGLKVPYPADDLLFVEDGVYRWGLREEYAICGFYSKDPAVRQRAGEYCDALSLERGVPDNVREQARNNIFFYLSLVTDLFPSWRARRFDFIPPDGYHQMSPSVCRLGDRLMVAERTVNYWITPRGYATPNGTPEKPVGDPIHTRTYLMEIDPDTLADRLIGEIRAPVDLPPPANSSVLGFEDSRLFYWRGDLWTTSTVLEQNPDGLPEIWLARIGQDFVLEEARAIHPQGRPIVCEKNWMPFVDGDQLSFVYWSDPTIILADHGQTLAQYVPEMAADHFRGSSQLMPFDGGWLGAIHSCPWVGGWPPKYYHRFVWFNDRMELKAASRGFRFPSSEGFLSAYQYIMGVCWHPDEERIVVSHQREESTAWIGTIDADDMRRALDLSRNGQRAHWDEAEAGGFNRALQTASQVDVATRNLKVFGLPEHRDRVKNWDTWLAIKACHLYVPKNGEILDAGASRGWSAFLPGLAKLGYTKLTGVNLEGETGYDGAIIYDIGDITNSPYQDGRFSFVASLSTIEHGVDLATFFKEMARIIKPDGHLFLSFDYWEMPIDTGGQQAFGAPVKIFDSLDVADLRKFAVESGFFEVGDVDLRCRERVVEWIGLRFTFANLLFERA